MRDRNGELLRNNYAFAICNMYAFIIIRVYVENGLGQNWTIVHFILQTVQSGFERVKMQ